MDRRALNGIAVILSHVALWGLAAPGLAQSESAPAEDKPAATERAQRRAAPDVRNDPPGAGPQAQEPGKNSNGGTGPRKIVVVVCRKNPIDSLTLVELERIFLRRTTNWPNRWPITVYERPAGKEIHRRFSKAVFDKPPGVLKEHWMNLQLTRGLKPPKVLRSPMLVKRYLQRVKGGVAYLYEDEVDETVKVVEIRDAEFRPPQH